MSNLLRKEYVETVSELLGVEPNFAITQQPVGELQNQIVNPPAYVRDFLVRFSDRKLFGEFIESQPSDEQADWQKWLALIFIIACANPIPEEVAELFNLPENDSTEETIANIDAEVTSTFKALYSFLVKADTEGRKYTSVTHQQNWASQTLKGLGTNEERLKKFRGKAKDTPPVPESKAWRITVWAGRTKNIPTLQEIKDSKKYKELSALKEPLQISLTHWSQALLSLRKSKDHQTPIFFCQPLLEKKETEDPKFYIRVEDEAIFMKLFTELVKNFKANSQLAFRQSSV
jgi:hypothetical protein